MKKFMLNSRFIMPILLGLTLCVGLALNVSAQTVKATIKAYFDPQYPQKIESGNATVQFGSDGIDILVDNEKVGRVPLQAAGNVTITVYDNKSCEVKTDGGVYRLNETTETAALDSVETLTTPETPEPPDTPEIPGEDDTSDKIRTAEEAIKRAEEVIKKAEKARERGGINKHGDMLRFGSSVEIGPDEVVEGNLVVMGGAVVILGKVRGDAVCIGGSMTVEGEVGRDAVVMGGALSIGDEAGIGRDAVCIGGSMDRAENAKIGGQSVTVDGIDFLSHAGIFNRNHEHNPNVDVNDFVEETSSFGGRLADLIRNILFTLLGLAAVILIVVFAPQRLENSAVVFRQDFGRSFLFGALTTIALPFVLLILTLLVCIGWPFVPIVAIGYALLMVFGYAIAAMEIGRFLNNRFALKMDTPFKRATIGVFALELLSLVGDFIALPGSFTVAIGIMLMFVGFAFKLILVTTGLGAALISKVGQNPVEPVVTGLGGTYPATTESSVTSVVNDVNRTVDDVDREINQTLGGDSPSPDGQQPKA